MRKFIAKLFNLVLPEDILKPTVNELLASIQPPRQFGLTELQELSALSSMHSELSEQYFEQMAYNEMVAHIQAVEPEERLIIKGRHSVWTELLNSTKTAGTELKEKDEEEVVRKRNNET